MMERILESKGKNSSLAKLESSTQLAKGFIGGLSGYPNPALVF